MATTKTYADLRTELDELLMWFEGEDIDVDEAIAKYEHAIKLTKQLETYLKQAENKVLKLKGE